MAHSHEAQELHLYVSNVVPLWQRVEALARLYERKRAKGIYDHDKAIKGFGPLLLEAAHHYSREHSTGRDGPAMFPPHVRRETAALLLERIEDEWAAGNYWSIEA